MRSHQQMPDIGQLLDIRRIETRELAKALLCPTITRRQARTMHYGAELASTRLSSVSAGVRAMWRYRDAMSRTRPDARPCPPQDDALKALLERVIFKHPKVRAPRAQSAVSRPGTKPFAFYTRPFGRGVGDADDDSDSS